MFHLFQVIIYQPFFNLLVGIYWLLGLIPAAVADMGVAVVIFTVVIRILLLPISWSAMKGEQDRRKIEEQVKEIEKKYAHDPVLARKAVKQTFRFHQRVVWSELVSLSIQVIISLMLWRIFATGLPGEDIHLLYSWMPEVAYPYNLVFLGRYDLSHPDWHLNVVQSLLIFVLETLNVYISPYPVNRGEVVRLQLILPLMSFVIFSQLPAGKKLFVISTLLFSIGLTLIQALLKKAHEIQERLAQQEKDAQNPEEKVVVEIK